MSNFKPTVSVLMPVYNAERYLREAVNSILAQTYQDFEFIIVDDGSTDSSPDILREYAILDTRIRILTRPKLGLTAALNAGLESATGRYVARMDADDISFPERFAKQVGFLDKNSQVAVVGAQFVKIDELGRQLSFSEKLPCESWRIICRMVSLWSVCHPLAMFRKDVILSVGGYRDVEAGEDYDLWLRVAQVACLANLGEVLLKYRVHDKSITGTKKFFLRSEVYPNYSLDLFGMSSAIACRLYQRKMFFFVLPWVFCSAKKIAKRFSVSQIKILFCREFVDAWMVLAWKQDPLTTVVLLILKIFSFRERLF